MMPGHDTSRAAHAHESDNETEGILRSNGTGQRDGAILLSNACSLKSNNNNTAHT